MLSSVTDDIVHWDMDDSTFHGEHMPLCWSLAQVLSCGLDLPVTYVQGLYVPSRLRSTEAAHSPRTSRRNLYAARAAIRSLENAWKARYPKGSTAVCTKQYHQSIRDYCRGVPLACLDTGAAEHDCIGSGALKRLFKVTHNQVRFTLSP